MPTDLLTRASVAIDAYERHQPTGTLEDDIRRKALVEIRYQIASRHGVCPLPYERLLSDSSGQNFSDARRDYVLQRLDNLIEESTTR
jgi:hypothetical protein